MPSDHMETIFRFDSRFKTVIPARAQWESGTCPRGGSVTVFTDGSKTSEGTGSGIYCEEREIALSVPLGISATVFQSEIVAIGECCRVLTEEALSNETVIICADSESAIGALASSKLSANLCSGVGMAWKLCRKTTKFLWCGYQAIQASRAMKRLTN